MTESYDVVIVGAGAAGLSGGTALARSRRSVLVVDAGEPRNAPAAGVHNFLTRDGTPPAELYAAGRAEVTSYGGTVQPGRVTALRRDGALFGVQIGERAVTARRLLVATGLRDELPEVPGLAARWGIDVLHCPYCHGWEVRGKRIGVLATGPAAAHQALLFRQLSPHVTVLRHTGPELTDEQREQFAALGITVVEGKVTRVEAGRGGLTGVALADGTRLALDALTVLPFMAARAELLAPLGLTPTEVLLDGQPIGTQIEADPSGATSVPGLWVAGNLADMHAHVITSAAAGLTAAAAINADLAGEDARRAADGHRQHEHPRDEQGWDERYRSRPQIWSGDPNPALVAEVAGLPPGTAFDAGTGEGADACWLAARGWKVTAADISTVALERAAAQAGALGLDITWLHADLTQAPVPGTYDLVTAHYLHGPKAERELVFRQLAAAVAPGGTLLVVGHDFSDQATTMPRPHLAEMGWTASELAAALGQGWMIETAEARPRRATDPDGREVTVHDAVLRARRDRSG
jgi:thioredoxin reductase/trans-aconitate methyltransferase